MVCLDLQNKTHRGTRQIFNDRVVKEQRLNHEWGAFYSRLFNYRIASDYEDFFEVEREVIEPWIEKAGSFIEAIEKLIRTYQ